MALEPVSQNPNQDFDPNTWVLAYQAEQLSGPLAAKHFGDACAAVQPDIHEVRTLEIAIPVHSHTETSPLNFQYTAIHGDPTLKVNAANFNEAGVPTAERPQHTTASDFAAWEIAVPHHHRRGRLLVVPATKGKLVISSADPVSADPVSVDTVSAVSLDGEPGENALQSDFLSRAA